MAHLDKQKQQWQGNNFQNQQFKQDEDEEDGDSQYDEDFEQEEVLGDDHDIYGFEDEGDDDQEYYDQGYENGSGDFEDGIDAPNINNGRSSGGSS